MHFVSSTVTACAACRASDKKRVLYHHTMSARARTTTGSRERGRPRAVPGVLRENHLPQQTPAQSHSHPLSLFCVSHDISSVPCSFPMISHLFRARILGTFSGVIVIRFTAFLAPLFIHTRFPASLEPRSHGQRWSHFHRTHEFVGLFFRQPITSQCQRHDGATAAALCRAATRPPCICQDTHILTLQWALYAG